MTEGEELYIPLNYLKPGYHCPHFDFQINEVGKIESRFSYL